METMSLKGIIIVVLPNRVEVLNKELNQILLFVIKNFPCNKILSFKAQLKLSIIFSPFSNSSSLFILVFISFNFFKSSSFIF